MAQTKKKTTTGKKTAASPEKQKSKRPIRREVGGVCFLLLGILVAASYFQKDEDAFLIHLSRAGLRGLVGYGYYLTALAFFLVAWILLLHRGRNVTLPLTSALLTPVFASALWHTLFCREDFASGLSVLGDLYVSGKDGLSGGVLGGGLSIGFCAVVGKTVSLIVFTVLVLTFLMVALRLTPAALYRRWKERERIEYEEEEEREAKRRPPERAASHPPVSRMTPSNVDRYDFDIPLDEEPARIPAAEKQTRSAAFPTEKPERRSKADAIFAETALEEKPQKKPTLGEETAARETAQVAREIAENRAAEEERDYEYPPISLLRQGKTQVADAEAETGNNARRLAETLRSFGVTAVAGDVVRGPSVTRYEFMLEQGVKLSKVTNLADDIALALGASGVRIAPIPNKISVVGVEVPNRVVSPVPIREIIESETFAAHGSRVAFAVGKDIGGHHIVGDIAKLPHILIAGTTGSGKSVCTNSLIVSLLYKSSPEDVRFIMVDPKMVELAPYNGIPHLLIPVVTDPKKAAGALQWAVYEMMKRYKTFSEHGVKDLKGYNELASRGEAEHLPSVVVVIDELADLMLIAAKEVEESICRVAQMGRAAGVHLVIATQRPSADVITGLMKANIPSRIAFAVASSLESRIILDNSGAEKLVGRGDMLYAPLGEGKPHRVQGCLITAEEIAKVVDFVKKNGGEASYDSSVMEHIDRAVAESERTGKAPAQETEEEGAADELLPAAVEVIFETGQASVSMLQRRLKLGYARAARLVDQMEERGIVGPFEGSKPRQILITRAKWQEMQMAGGGTAEAEPEEAAESDDAFAPQEE